MKRFTLLNIILFTLASTAFSQIKPFRFGVKVAPNIAWMSPDSKDYVNNGIAPGFAWGFLADITIADNYFIKTGFSIDYLGGKLSYPYTMTPEGDTLPLFGTIDRKYNMRYIQIPLTIKMRTNKFGSTAFFGEIGFGSSFNLRAKSKDVFYPNWDQPSIELEQDIKDEVVLFRESLIVGAGIEYFIDESTSLVFALNFNNGLTNVLKGYNSVNTNVKQRAQLYYLQLEIGIIF
jgi:hypothetical protein